MAEKKAVQGKERNDRKLSKGNIVTGIYESTRDVSITSTKDVWNKILEESTVFDKAETEDYIRSRDPDYLLPNPEVAYLNQIVLPLLQQALIEMLQKLKDDNSFYLRKSTLNGLDYLSEYLYNKNPNHPERELNWTYIFDMPWVNDYLEEKPRPYYPFHLVWSNNFAALKIQSFMRGYWARCRPDVQELRHFWKTLKEN